MLRIALGVIAGFFTWMILWVGIEKILSALMPAWYGAPQKAFQEAIEKGGQFTAETQLLISHVVIISLVSAAAGFVAAAVAGENSRAPMFLAILLLVMGVAKASMSWQYVPLWYHVAYTILLVAMAVAGGRVKTPA